MEFVNLFKIIQKYFSINLYFVILGSKILWASTDRN